MVWWSGGFVYPGEEPGAWQKQFAALLARSGIRRVAVFGGWKNTAISLRGRGVAFDDFGDDEPGEVDAHTLCLGLELGNVETTFEGTSSR